jgi:hypothetical protein
MAEIAIPEPLSGQEIIEALIFRIRQQLIQDCYLNPSVAYESFSGEITIKIRAIDCGRSAVVEKTIVAESGVPFNPEAEGALELTTVQEIPTEPPNVVRRESGQGVPVMTEDSGGRKEVRRVHYARKGNAKAAAKNAKKAGAEKE